MSKAIKEKLDDFKYQVNNQLKARNIPTHIWWQLKDQVWGKVGDQVEDQVYQVEDQVYQDQVKKDNESKF